MPEYYLGIDVGYSNSRPTTGLCLLTIDQTNFRWSNCHNTGSGDSERREALRSLVPKGTSLAGVGIDGPLTSHLNVVKHYRSADALLSRGLFQKRGKPGQTNSGTGKRLHEHATRLAKLVLSLETEEYLYVQDATHSDAIHENRIVEVFPTAFLAVLLSDTDFTAISNRFQHERIPRGKKSDEFWKKAVKEGYLWSPHRMPSSPDKIE